MWSASSRGSRDSRNARVPSTRPRPTSFATIFRSSSHAFAAGISSVSDSRSCNSTTSTPRSRILFMNSRWSRRAFCTHITSSKSREPQFVGVSRSCASPGAQTSTLRNWPTSECTPYSADGTVTASLTAQPSRRLSTSRSAMLLRPRRSADAHPSPGQAAFERPRKRAAGVRCSPAAKHGQTWRADRDWWRPAGGAAWRLTAVPTSSQAISATARLWLALAWRLVETGVRLGRRAGSIDVRGLDMIRRDELSEYVRGSLWVLPTLSVLGALVAGSLLSLVKVGSGSPLAFQGTADDARTLLIGITATMVTVIA